MKVVQHKFSTNIRNSLQMERLLLLFFLLLAGRESLCQTGDTKLELLAPRGRSYATTYEQYAAFPRRRSSSSSPSGEMQSRAVDTSADFEVLEGQPRGTTVGFIPTKPALLLLGVKGRRRPGAWRLCIDILTVSG